MELAATFAVQPTVHYAPRSFSEATSTIAAATDVAGASAADDTRADTGAAGNTSTDRTLDRQAEQVDEEREVVRSLTAEDFAAIQEQLGLRRRDTQNEDTGIPGDIHPGELIDLAIADEDAGLSIRETLDTQAKTGQQQEQDSGLRPSLPLPDFSSVVEDAVVTIDEYLDWVNEVGGQPR